MKEQPPFSVLLAAGISIAYGGSVLADMLVRALDGEYHFYLWGTLGIITGYGLLKGFEICRAWLMIVSGIAGFGALLVLLYSTITLMFSKGGEPREFVVLILLLPMVALGLVTFFGVRSSAAFEWCKTDGLGAKSSSMIAGLFCLCGLMIALPGELELGRQRDELRKQQELIQSIRLIWTEFSFQTKTGEPVKEEVHFLAEIHGPRYDEYDTQVRGSSHRNPDGSTRILVSGVTARPVIVSFSATGYANYDFTITNGCLPEVVLTLRPAYTNLSQPTNTR